jgi:hypothetical protein
MTCYVFILKHIEIMPLKNPNHQGKVLKDHFREGARFIPPGGQLGFTEISYIHQILPEIVWMGLINEELGLKEGIEFSKNIAILAKESINSKVHYNFAITSSYENFNGESSEIFKIKLDKVNLLKPLNTYLKPLLTLYKGVPFEFLKIETDVEENLSLIEKMKIAISKNYDKYGTPALILQANVVYIRGILGGLHLPKDMEVPNIDALINDPESEEAKRVGGFVRVSAMMELMPMGKIPPNKWSKSFWNQGYLIDKCDFSRR